MKLCGVLGGSIRYGVALHKTTYDVLFCTEVVSVNL